MTINDLKAETAGRIGADLSRRIIELLEDVPLFKEKADHELALLKKRDEEDAYKLDQGIEFALAKGVLKPLSEDGVSWNSLGTQGKTPEEIFDDLKARLPHSGPGTVIALCGDSGVGKGTLVQLMLARIPGTVTWSNGDMFRLLTYLTLEADPGIESHPERLESMDFSALASAVSLTGEGVSLDMPDGPTSLEQLKNGVLKQTSINRFLPTVARFTQGEVINLTNGYLELNQSKTILLEGRKQTLSYLKADYRYELVMESKEVLGARRAAQKIAAYLAQKSDSDMDVIDYLKTIYD